MVLFVEYSLNDSSATEAAHENDRRLQTESSHGGGGMNPS
jgi:hypothetical protein